MREDCGAVGRCPRAAICGQRVALDNGHCRPHPLQHRAQLDPQMVLRGSQSVELRQLAKLDIAKNVEFGEGAADREAVLPAVDENHS